MVGKLKIQNFFVIVLRIPGRDKQILKLQQPYEEDKERVIATLKTKHMKVKLESIHIFWKIREENTTEPVKQV